FLRCFAAILIEGHFILAMLAREHGVEGLFDPFPSLRLRPNWFVVVDDPVGTTSGASGVANNLSCSFALWIDAKVNAAERHSLRQLRYGRVVFFGRPSGGTPE